jgi:hypothetical protein
VTVGLLAVPAQRADAASSGSDIAALAVLAPGAAVSEPGAAGPIALTGAVTIGGKKAVGAGVPVLLFAAPSLDKTASAKVGDRLELPLVAATLTDAKGNYTFTEKSVISALKSLGSPYQEVVVPSLTESGTTLVNLLSTDKSAALGTTPEGGLAAAPAPVGTASANSNAAAGLNAGGLATCDGDISLSSAPVSAKELKARTVGDGAPKALAEKCTVSTCIVATLMSTWNQHVGIAQAQSKVSYVNVQLTYQKGSASTLGIGLSSTGNVGSYKQSTTTTGKSSLKIEFAERKGIQNVYYRTDFVYGKYKHEIYVLNHRTKLEYKVAPTGGFAGGNYSYIASGNLKSKNPAQYCTAYKKGDKVTQDKTKATTWSNGVDITSLGLGLSSQTGYDVNTSLKFTFATGNAYLCGVDSAPGGAAPGLLYASLTKS